MNDLDNGRLKYLIKVSIITRMISNGTINEDEALKNPSYRQFLKEELGINIENKFGNKIKAYGEKRGK